jgi:two-component system, LuxR family, sensor kinase FixL
MLIGTRGTGRRLSWRVPPGEFRSVTIVERATAPACALAPSGLVVAANQALEELFGARSGGLAGRPLISLVYPQDLKRARGVLSAVFGDGLDRYQVDQRCARLDDQRIVWGAWDLSLVRDARGRPEFAIAIVRDLTEIRQAEQDRRFFEFMLKVIGEAQDSDAMLAAAIQTICHFTRCAMGQVWLPSGQELACHPSWYAGWYGFDQLRGASEPKRYALGDGLPGLVWATGEPVLVRDAHDSDRFDRSAPAGRAGVRDAMAVPIKTASGVVAVLEFFVSSDRVAEPGRLQRIAKVVRELSPLFERRLAEEALRASEERFRGVTNAATDAIVSADADGCLRSWNRGAERMFGWRADEVVGLPLTVIVPERLRAAHEAGIARVRSTGTSKLAGTVVELTALHKDGHEFPIELSIGAWLDGDGLTFSGIIRDITERKKAQDAISAANRELERTNAELETLVYSASHDLKSPMVSLLGYLEYLKVDYGDVLGEEGNHYVERISGCTLYMQRLIHDLIDLSRVGHLTGEATEIDLAELTSAIVDEATAGNPRMTVDVRRLPIVTADPTSFRQLLTNLIENAIQHGGRPDLRVTVQGVAHVDGGFELTVSDDGKGIPPEHRERVFGVFERLDGHTTSGGTGMGLAICRKIVELLGGAITIHGGGGSLAGNGSGGGRSHGTEVRVVLPATIPVRWPPALPQVARREPGALLLRERRALA